jgi:phage terminase large subunit-like protein
MGAIDPRYPPLPRPVTIENLTDEDLAALTRAQLDRLGTPHEGPCDWRFWARDEQMAPSGDWATWLYLAGRGAGKTRAGAEWVLDKVRTGTRIIHLVAPTEADYRDVMIHGPAGLVTIAKPNERPKYIKQDRKVLFPNGAYAICFSAEQPERLRGPQCEAAWCDEIAAGATSTTPGT